MKFKKSKVKSLPKAGNGLNTPIKGTKEQYDRWKDSSDLNLYTNLQHQLEPRWSVIQGNAFQNLGIGQDSEFAKNQHRLFNTADSLIRNNPNLEWGSYGDPFADSKGQNSLRKQYSSRGGNSPDIRSKGNVIKPSNFWTGAAANHDYIQPVQPIIYQPEAINPIQGGHSFPNTGTAWNGTFQQIQNQTQRINPLDLSRPKEQPINIQSAKPDLLQGSNQQLEFNPIGFQKGSYFTTNDDQQEQAGLRYWDKKTGRQLKKFGGLTKAKDGLITDPRQDSYYTPSKDNTSVNKFTPISEQQKGSSFKLADQGRDFAASRPATGQADYSPINVEDFIMLPGIIGDVGNIARKGISKASNFLENQNIYKNLPENSSISTLGVGKGNPYLHNKSKFLLSDAEAEVNDRLSKGLGINKTGNNLSVKLGKGEDTDFKFRVYENNKHIGEVGLNKKFTNPENNRGLFYEKDEDFPYAHRSVEDYKGSGISGEVNKAITDMLQNNQFGKLKSSLNHTPDGLERWKKLVDKGLATQLENNRFELHKFGGKVNTDWEIVQDDNEWEFAD